MGGEDRTLCLPAASVDFPEAVLESCTVRLTTTGASDRLLSFSKQCLNRFHQPDAWLNDDCINLGGVLLLEHFRTAGVHSVSLFSSWIYPNRDRDDNVLWRLSRNVLERPKTEIWLLPIHLDNHWTLAIIYREEQRIAYFDSLGDTETMEPVTQVS